MTLSPEHTLPLALLFAWLLDLLIGDPARLPHPVVWFGKWISFWEKSLNKGKHRKLKGALLATTSIILTFAAAYALLLPSYPFCLGLVLQTLLIFYCLAGKTLRREVRMVFEALDRSIEEGRRQVSRIVGRDTDNLSANEVRTAALETLSENLSDGVIAPLFWLCILGVPGMLAYKMTNTLDSMIGYHSPRYKDFGCWAARIDDIANYIPARLTALIITLTGWIYNKLHHSRPAHTLVQLAKFVTAFGPKHASPNSGWPEAAMTSILDCRFGGAHDYFGETFPKPYIGNNPRQLTTNDMRTGIAISLTAECIFIALSILILPLNPIIPQ